MAAYEHSAAFYDLLYSWKDYPTEVETLRQLIARYDGPAGGSLLDVACGTGAHLEHLTPHYACAGVDLEPGLLQVARGRLPDDVPLHKADMRDFDLGQTFDVVTCLFSAIGYMLTLDDLNRAVAAMARHVAPGGLLLVEPWFGPEQFIDGHRHALLVENDDMKVCRMNISRVEGRLSVLDFHYLVAAADGISYFTELHQMALFTVDEYRAAFEAAGLQTHYDDHGLTGRGLYIGRRTA